MQPRRAQYLNQPEPGQEHCSTASMFALQASHKKGAVL
jgi:hypothetical protein